MTGDLTQQVYCYRTIGGGIRVFWKSLDHPEVSSVYLFFDPDNQKVTVNVRNLAMIETAAAAAVARTLINAQAIGDALLNGTLSQLGFLRSHPAPQADVCLRCGLVECKQHPHAGTVPLMEYLDRMSR